MSVIASKPLTGQPVDRTDGRAKVTGSARYAAEFSVKAVVQVVMVQSTITSGKIRNIDTSAADKAPGVLAILTHKNAPKLHAPPKSQDGHPGEKLLPLQSDVIYYNGQTIGLVIADTFEHALEAARLVRCDYEENTPIVTIENALGQAYEPESYLGMLKLQLSRGDVAQAMSGRDIVAIEATYITPVEHHNPMEPHASIAEWEGDRLKVYTSTQAVVGTRQVTAAVLGIPEEKVQIISPFVGGGFGCKGFVWAHPYLAAIAARAVGRPAKLVHTRQQMFTANGHRPRTIQKLALGATRDGELIAIGHEVTSHTSMVDEFIPGVGNTSAMLYAAPNAEVRHRLTKLNVGTGTPTRAPGEAPGTYGLESAMDELAYALRMDPLQLRLINYTDTQAQKKLPWSSNHLKECYARGAESFGWSKRSFEPRSMHDGRFLIGYGMATATYPAHRGAASAKVQAYPDGRIVVSSATQDIGTGTYTILAQVAADALGVPMEHVEVHIGDSALPKAPGSGGSRTAASVAPAVRDAALNLRKKVAELAGGDSPPGESFAELLRRKNLLILEADATAKTVAEAMGKEGEEQEKAKPKPALVPIDRETNSDEEKYAFQSFGAHFVEVAVDPEVGEIRVRRVVSAMDIGCVLNAKTARSQIQGGVVWGIGMALMEKTAFDERSGRIVTRNLADYLVPVNADVPDIEVIFIDIPDTHISSVGCRGVGEIGITGITAAIANAVYHATGKRIRELPITPDKLI